MSFEEFVQDTVNLNIKCTGINTRICISSKEHLQTPRIKVYNDNNSEHLYLSIEDTPKILAGNSSIISQQILAQVRVWITLNKELLLYYWEHPEMDAYEIVEMVQKVK